ncbi:FHA domain-containing protein [Candidatus Poribacteria bacterium]|nr:FHA domain-containing protein [Candidatus Poribacteria bacterium]
MKKLVRRDVARLICLGFLAMAVLHPASRETQAASEPGKAGKRTATVYVIDTSSSMQWIISDIKRTLRKTVKESGAGDSFTILLAGDRVTTLACYTSLEDSKKETLVTLLDSIKADSLYSDLGAAVNEATGHLYKYCNDGVADLYRLILVTDGIDHPSPDTLRTYTMEQAMTQFDKFAPGKQWFLRYIALKGRIDPDLLSLMNKYNGSFFDVEEISRISGVSEREMLEGLIENSEDWQPLDAAIIDKTDEITVKESVQPDVWWTVPKGGPLKLLGGDQVKTGRKSRVVINVGRGGRIGLDTNSAIALERLQTLSHTKLNVVKIRLEKGTVWTTLDTSTGGLLSYEVVTPLAAVCAKGTSFAVAYNGLTRRQVTTVFEGTVDTRPLDKRPAFAPFASSRGMQTGLAPNSSPLSLGPIPGRVRTEWEKWEKVLKEGIPLSRVNFESVVVTPLVERLMIGPMKNGEKYVAECALQFSAEYFGEAHIIPQAIIELPGAVEIETEIVDAPDNPLRKSLRVKLQCPARLKHTRSEDYLGRVRLSCSDPTVEFSNEYVELQVINPHTFLYWLKRVLASVARHPFAVAVVVVAVGSSPVLYLGRRKLRKWEAYARNYLRDKIVKTKLVHLIRARPIGHMIPRGISGVRDGKILNLAKISRYQEAVILGVGSDSKNDICLSHESVKPFHCSIWAGRKRNPTRVYIESSSDEPIVINGETVKGTRQIKDKDMIGIGAYTFEFMDPQCRRQVRAHMNDGGTHEGILEYWDLGQSVFYMNSFSGAREEFLTLRFVEVCYVEFYRDESNRKLGLLPSYAKGIRSRQGRMAAIMLENGRTIEGIVHRNYRREDSSGVILLTPDDREEMEYAYIPSTSVRTVTVKE